MKRPDPTPGARGGRFETGVPGLDRVLGGGLFRGGSYMITGTPGAGKTVLANHVAYNHVKAGGRAIYITLLAETHARMIQHMSAFTFCDPSVVGRQLVYLSGYRGLEQGPAALMDLVRRSLLESRATLLVLDGAVNLAQMDDGAHALKRFLHEQQAFLETLDCAALLLASTPQHPPGSAEHPLVDGVLDLSQPQPARRAVRELFVEKVRGSASLPGPHLFQITRDGFVVHPRLESLPLPASADLTHTRQRVPLGVAELDRMLGGGLLSGTSTLVLGAPGTGKTTLGMHFLAEGAARNERVLHVGFYEPPSRLLEQGEALGLKLKAHAQAGRLDVLWCPPFEGHLDAVAAETLHRVRENAVRRVVIDGLQGLQLLSAHAERIPQFLAAFLGELRRLDTTTLLTAETRALFDPAPDVPMGSVSTLAEGLLFLRQAELRAQQRRLISIVKMRESAYDPSVREFHIRAGGIVVGSAPESGGA